MEFNLRDKFDDESATSKLGVPKQVSNIKEDFELYYEKDLGVRKYYLIDLYIHNNCYFLKLDNHHGNYL